MDPEVFYPPGSDLHTERTRNRRGSVTVTETLSAIRFAKSICADCTVRRECLVENLFEEFGIWAGTTPVERHAMLKVGRRRLLS